MSYTTMLAIPANGPYESVEEFGNSWGAAARVWTAMSQKYLGSESAWLVSGIDKGGSSFWRLVDDQRLTPAERLAFAFTFDGMICERDRAGDLAEALREFDRLHPRQAGYVNHLPAIADALERHAAEDVIGFAFIQTSVSSDVWYVNEDCPDAFHKTADAGDDGYCPTCDGEKDDPRHSTRFAWDRHKDTGTHFMLFERYGEPVSAA